MKPHRLLPAIQAPSGILRGALVPVFLCFLLIPCLLTDRAAAQSADAQTEQQQITNVLSNPALVTRAYRQFFTYQHYLDSVADQQEAAGRDASELRKVLQRRFGFSDTEYKAIRAACDRVAAEMTTLRSEIKSNPTERASYAEVRDQKIQTEITTLTIELSAQKKMAFETQLVRMFIPRQEIQKGVQQ